MVDHRTTDRGRNPYSNARGYAAPAAPHLDENTCACADAAVYAAAILPADTAVARASCSRANPLVATSRECAHSRNVGADARYHGCVTATPTGPWPRCACTTPLAT